MSNMRTALLIDGNPDPIGLRVDKQERVITWGGGSQAARTFKFVREQRDLLIYRLATGDGISDEEFEYSTAIESDKYLNPDKYMKMGRPDYAAKEKADKERAELAEYRRRFGPLTEVH
jgi:hypothetical protein